MALWKKGLIAFGVMVFLLLTAAIVIPLVVDVDRYRPLLTEKINERIHGKAEIGKLTLSLWGQVLVRIDGVTVQDAAGRKIVSVGEAYFHVPFTSILSGSPELTLRMIEPDLTVVKDRGGVINLLKLVQKPVAQSSDQPRPQPQSQAESRAQEPEESEAGETPSAETTTLTLPALATRARLSVELRDAHVVYRDEGQGLKNDVDRLNLRIRNISLSEPLNLEMWADLKTTLGKDLQLSGPARIEGKVTPKIVEAQFQGADAVLRVNLDQVELVVPGTFEKKAGVAAHLDADVRAGQESIQIEKFAARFHNAEFKLTGAVQGLKTTPQLKLLFQSNDIHLKGWDDMVAAMKEYRPEGKVQLSGSVSGPLEGIQYQAKLAVKDVSFTGPRLKARPVLKGHIDVDADAVKELDLRMKAPGSDLALKGSVIAFKKPRFNFSVVSKALDLDQMMEFPPPGTESESESEAKPKETTQTPTSTVGADRSTAANASKKKAVSSARRKGTAPQSLDASLDPLRKNPAARVAEGTFNVDIQSLKAQGVTLSEVRSSAKLKNLALDMERFSFKLFDGAIFASASADLKPTPVTYRYQASIDDLNMKKAVESQMELFKNTVYGLLDLNIKGSGAGLDTDAALAALNAQGNVRINEAVFATVDIGKMVAEAVNSSLARAAAKVPALRGKQIKELPDRKSLYDVVSSDFSISGGRFTAPNFVAKAKPGKGVDLEGSTTLHLLNHDLAAKWWIKDSHNLTQAMSLENGILVEPGSVFKFPVTVGGTLSSPTYSYGEVPEYLAGVALRNLAGAAKAKAEAALKKEAEKRLQKAVPENAKKKLQDAIRRFKF